MKADFSVGMGRNLAIAEVASHSKLAEDCGFSHLTMIDSQNLSRDVYSMMTLAALNTHRIKIGHGVTNPFTRHPSVTATASATINEVSGGRAFVGIGAGFSSVMTMGMNARTMQEVPRDGAVHKGLHCRSGSRVSRIEDAFGMDT